MRPRDVGERRSPASRRRSGRPWTATARRPSRPLPQLAGCHGSRDVAGLSVSSAALGLGTVRGVGSATRCTDALSVRPAGGADDGLGHAARRPLLRTPAPVHVALRSGLTWAATFATCGVVGIADRTRARASRRRRGRPRARLRFRRVYNASVPCGCGPRYTGCSIGMRGGCSGACTGGRSHDVAYLAAQRSLSKPARTLRRHVRAIDGTVTFDDGHQQHLTTTSLIAPLEAALQATAAAVVALAVALVIYRTTTP